MRKWEVLSSSSNVDKQKIIIIYLSEKTKTMVYTTMRDISSQHNDSRQKIAFIDSRAEMRRSWSAFFV